jgi:hypothetical protein
MKGDTTVEGCQGAHISTPAHEENAAEHTVDLTNALAAQPATAKPAADVGSQLSWAALEYGHRTQGGDFFGWLDAGPCEVNVERPALCPDTSRLEGCFHR